METPEYNIIYSFTGTVPNDAWPVEDEELDPDYDKGRTLAENTRAV